MNELTSNPNIDWQKKSGFDEDERITLKVNVKKAEEYDARKKSVQKSSRKKNVEQTIGLKKIRKKIKDVFDDEEEDEDDYQISIQDIERSNSLLNALTDDERTILKQKETINTSKQLQDAGKMGAILAADKFAKDVGLDGIKKEHANNEMQNATSFGKESLHSSVKEDIAKKMDIKWKKVSDREMINLLRGIKRIQQLGGDEAVKGMAVKDVAEIGEKRIDENKIAELLLEKSGRDKKARQKEIERKRFERYKGKVDKDLNKFEKER